MKKVKAYEPWFFIFFGIFHLHRIWGFFDRQGYADFWVGVMVNKGIFYFSLMGILAILCILGIGTFIKNLRQNYWWRWIYLFGGSYLLFDLFAIATGLQFWHKLILNMYDVNSPYWNVILSAFVLLGGFVFVLGILLLKKLEK